MDIELSSEDLEFEKEVRAFLSENAYKPGEDPNAWRMGWFEKAREKGGWDVPKWPEKFGGPGWTPNQHYIWQKETAAASKPWDLPFGLSMLAPVLMAYGSEEQQQRFLPDIRARKVNWCQGYSEPGAGSDLASLKTKAELSEDGTYYLVNGTKIWTTMAHIADWIFCLTRTSDDGIKQEGITFLLFPMKQEGVEVKPIITLGGSHTVNTVFFQDVKVPVENRIGEEGKGWTYAKGLLEHERSMISGMGMGAGAASMGGMEAVAKENFGTDGDRIANPAIRSAIAAHKMDQQAFGLTMKRAGEEAKAGQGMGAAASMFKYYGTEVNKRRFELLLDVMGSQALGWEGDGFDSKELAVTRSWLRSKGNSIEGGTSEVQLNVIAKRVLGLPTA